MAGSEMASMSGRAADAKVYLSGRCRVCYAPSACSDPALTAARSRISATYNEKPSGSWACTADLRVPSRPRSTDAFDRPVHLSRLQHGVELGDAEAGLVMEGLNNET